MESTTFLVEISILWTQFLWISGGGGDPNTGDIGKKEIDILKGDFDLVDPFRKYFPKQKVYTWSHPGKYLGCRLDRFYISKQYLNTVGKIEFSNSPFSDHLIYSLEIKVPSEGIKVGPAFWKCNTSILNDTDLKLELTNYILEAKSKNINIDWWENCKNDFKTIIIKHSTRISRERKNNINFIERQLAEYQKLQIDLPGAYSDEIKSLEKQ